MRWLIATGVGGVLFFGGGLRAASLGVADSGSREVVALSESSPAIIDEILFAGLHHLTAAAVQARILSRPGTLLDLRRIQSDVKLLSRLGWFAQIQVESHPAVNSHSPDQKMQRVRLVFRVVEFPYLANIQYSGSHLLSTSQIEKLLSEKQLIPALGEPADDFKLDRIAKTIESALAELGHPQARAQILREEALNGTLRVRFQIDDGPHLPVGHMDFTGHREISARLLRREMQRTTPGGLFASWRGKGVFTREGFIEDRSKLLIYYQNHGFPEARVGSAATSVYESTAKHWFLWPFCTSAQRLAVSVPIEAGPYYRLQSVMVGPELIAAARPRHRKLLAFSEAQSGTVYSAKTIEDLRHAWVAAVAPRHPKDTPPFRRDIEAARTFDQDTHRVLVRIAPADSTPYIVRRIEFRGQHRFSDRYLRRRIGLREGQPFDERGLESGLARLSKTGYFHQIRKEDIRIDRTDATYTADVLIRVSEAGQQRASFSGGQGQFGSTLGLAYSLFDLFQREELFSAQLDAGPETLQIALGLILEGFLGSRSSLTFSVFNNVLRPRFTSSLKGPFYISQGGGLNGGWSYPLTQTNTVSAEYGLAHSVTAYSIVLPPSLTGLPSPGLSADTTSSAVGLGFSHRAGGDHASVTNSVSGGALGGTENVIRSHEEYARIFYDPLLHHQNAWAFRASFNGAGGYQGDMPLAARLFSGDSQVRGFNSGQLGPYAVIPTTSPTGAATYTALPAGANMISAANAEYRVPLGNNVQAAGFFDLGSGWLLPNWLGPTKPVLLNSTNGVLHGSFGLELRWTIPELQVPVRAYIAVDVLRLNRFLQLPNGSLFRAHNKLLSFGWALGNLF